MKQIDWSKRIVIGLIILIFIGSAIGMVVQYVEKEDALLKQQLHQKIIDNE